MPTALGLLNFDVHDDDMDAAMAGSQRYPSGTSASDLLDNQSVYSNDSRREDHLRSKRRVSVFVVGLLVCSVCSSRC